MIRKISDKKAHTVSPYHVQFEDLAPNQKLRQIRQVIM